MIDGKKLFWSTSKNKKVATGQGDDYTTSFLLNYN